MLCSLNKKLVLRIEGVEEGAVRWFVTPLSDPSAEREVDKSAIPPNSRGMHLVLTRYVLIIDCSYVCTML